MKREYTPRNTKPISKRVAAAVKAVLTNPKNSKRAKTARGRALTQR